MKQKLIGILIAALCFLFLILLEFDLEENDTIINKPEAVLFEPQAEQDQSKTLKNGRLIVIADIQDGHVDGTSFRAARSLLYSSWWSAVHGPSHFEIARAGDFGKYVLPTTSSTFHNPMPCQPALQSVDLLLRVHPEEIRYHEVPNNCKDASKFQHDHQNNTNEKKWSQCWFSTDSLDSFIQNFDFVLTVEPTSILLPGFCSQLMAAYAGVKRTCISCVMTNDKNGKIRFGERSKMFVQTAKKSASFVVSLADHNEEKFPAVIHNDESDADDPKETFSYSKWKRRLFTQNDIPAPTEYLPWGPNAPEFKNEQQKQFETSPGSYNMSALPIGRSSAGKFAQLIAYWSLTSVTYFDIPRVVRNLTEVQCGDKGWQERLTQRQKDPQLKPKWLRNLSDEHHTDLMDADFSEYQDNKTIQSSRGSIATIGFLPREDARYQREVKSMLYPSWHYVTQGLLKGEVKQPLSPLHQFKSGLQLDDYERIDLILFADPVLFEFLSQFPHCHLVAQRKYVTDIPPSVRPKVTVSPGAQELAFLVHSELASRPENAHGVCIFIALKYDSVFVSKLHYPFMKSLMMTVQPGLRHLLLQYKRLLRSDLDVFLFPGLRSYRPDHPSITGRGGYGHDDFTWWRLEEMAAELGLRHQGVHKVGSTWFAEPELMLRTTPLALAASEYMLTYVHPNTNQRWSHWFRGVTSMYGTELAVNHVVDSCDTRVDMKLLDAASWWDYVDPAIASLHCWPKDTPFSKHAFHANQYTHHDVLKHMQNKATPRGYAFWIAYVYSCDILKLSHDRCIPKLHATH